jgi:hypothetical protein
MLDLAWSALRVWSSGFQLFHDLSDRRWAVRLVEPLMSFDDLNVVHGEGFLSFERRALSDSVRVYPSIGGADNFPIYGTVPFFRKLVRYLVVRGGSPMLFHLGPVEALNSVG